MVEDPSDTRPDPAPVPESTSGSPAGSSSASGAGGNPVKRYLRIGVPLVLILIVAFWLFFPRIELTIAINGLHSHDARTRGANAEKLRTYSDKDLVIEMLADAVEDDGRSFDVRIICARMLLDHFDRIGLLEKLMREGSPSTRAVVIKVLSIKPYFKKSYAEDPAYRVRETITEWLAREGDLTRFHAIQMAVLLDMREQLPGIRKLLSRTGAANIHAKEERDVIIAAAGAMRSFEVCDAVPEILAGALADPDALVRLRFMQIADDMSFRNDRPVPCPDAADESVMRSVVHKALDDPDHTVRMGGMLILGRRPNWAQEVLPRVQEILDSSLTGAERRHALEVLMASGDAAAQERIGLYFHDRDVAVRTTAAAHVADYPQLKLEGCLIGLLGAETESDQLFIDTLNNLRRISKQWIGLPTAWGAKAASDPSGFKGDLRTLFSRGEVGEVTRDGLAAAWFAWLCDRLGLTAEQKAEALAVRKAVWKAMDARDTKAAEAALAKLTFDTPGLFSYERAWLETRE